MKIFFQNRKMQKAANSESAGNRLWGVRAPKIRQRLLELKAANTLADVSKLPPPRCHQLTENLDEQFAVDISATSEWCSRSRMTRDRAGTITELIWVG